MTFTPTITDTPTVTFTPTHTVTNTFTPTATCSGAVTLGYIANANTDVNGDIMYFHSITAPANGVISSLLVQVGATGTYSMAFYNDNAGAPGNLLEQSQQASLDAAASAYRQVDIPPVTVTNGVVYWIAIWGTIDIRFRDSTGATFISYMLDGTGGVYPDPYPGPNTSNYNKNHRSFAIACP
jgi:hypothetical protein